MSCYEDLIPREDLLEQYKGYRCTDKVDMKCPRGYDETCCASCPEFYGDCRDACRRAEDWFIAKKVCRWAVKE